MMNPDRMWKVVLGGLRPVRPVAVVTRGTRASRFLHLNRHTSQYERNRLCQSQQIGQQLLLLYLLYPLLQIQSGRALQTLLESDCVHAKVGRLAPSLLMPQLLPLQDHSICQTQVARSIIFSLHLDKEVAMTLHPRVIRCLK